jgi:hypothetical protein
LKVQARLVAAELDRRVGETAAERLGRRRRARFIRHRDDTVSLVVGFGAEGAEVEKIVNAELDKRRAAQKTMAPEDRSSDEQLTQDAVVALIRGGGEHGVGDKPVAPMAIVRLGLEDLVELFRQAAASGGVVTSDGMPLTVEAARGLLADARIVPVLLDQSDLPVELAQAARRRLATMIQRAVLATMYTTCMVPGCEVPFDDCQVHHVVDFDGFNTVLANLGPVCAHEHGEHHAGRRVIGLDAERTVTITLPGGTVWARQEYRPPGHVGRRSKPSEPQAPPQAA